MYLGNSISYVDLKMEAYAYFFICSSLVLLVPVNLQILQYANRFRNFTIESETDSIHLINITIYQDKIDHKLAGSFNVTKDIYIKSIIARIYRCNYEKSACENFQKWKFIDSFKPTLYMKNQIWSPLVEHLRPKLDPPLIKKHVYFTPDANIDTNAVLALYPEAVKYFWRVDLTLTDPKERSAAIFKFETEYFVYSKRDRKRDRESSTKKP